MEEKEAPKERKLADVEMEYFKLCSKAGQAEYQIQIMKMDIAQLHEQMRALNHEAAALKAKESGEKHES